ncbi:MAG: FtsW/RodA/SpoVE family cell cycle protein, partial [Alistipes sp.]
MAARQRNNEQETPAAHVQTPPPDPTLFQRMRLFTGDRVLWIIVTALAVISILVVYSSTAKMAYDAHTLRTTSHFLRQQLMILIVSFGLLVAVHKINCRTY